jgi:uncharacterized protein YjbJ (UPF0337 family)
MSTGRDLADKAKNIAESSTDAIKGQGSDLVDAAKDVASQATDRLKDAVNDRKSSGAEYVGSLADTLRRAAREFDTDLPIAAPTSGRPPPRSREFPIIFATAI